MKFLIDECLGLPLVQIALSAGYTESSHVVWQGKAGWKDWRLVRVIADGGWTFVTRNANDFEDPGISPVRLVYCPAKRSTPALSASSTQ